MWSKIYFVALIAAASVAGTGVSDSRSASEKLSAIESGRVRRGAQVSLSSAELNAWMRDQAKVYVPQGVRNLRLDLAAGEATGYGDVDFLKV
ncbi:MAG: hypothetical protein KGN84_04175, partial [Acidobacteriota bacterium]|nr:hypothetical protein [Acidobacteriota bacterium]